MSTQDLNYATPGRPPGRLRSRLLGLSAYLDLAYGLLVLLVSRLEEGFGLMDQVAQVFFLLGTQKR